MNVETAEKAFSEMMEHWKTGLADRLYGEETKLNLGYRFDKKYWGKGYATELAQNAIAFGLNELNKNEIFALVRPKHLASIKVLEKCKMIQV